MTMLGKRIRRTGEMRRKDWRELIHRYQGALKYVFEFESCLGAVPLMRQATVECVPQTVDHECGFVTKYNDVLSVSGYSSYPACDCEVLCMLPESG